MENGNGYERHAMSFAYDALTMNTGLALLVDSIQRYGFDKTQPIVLFEGAVLDGWNRYQACKIAEVEPKMVEFDGTREEAIAFVLQHNSARRQMTKMQQAVAIRKMDNLMPVRKRRTADAVAAQLGASVAQVRKAFKMRDEAPDIADKVQAGKEPYEEAEQNLGYSNPPKTQGWILACTNSAVINRVHIAMNAIPGFRERATEKHAINSALTLWAEARATGGRMVVVPAQITDKQIEAFVDSQSAA